MTGIRRLQSGNRTFPNLQFNACDFKRDTLVLYRSRLMMMTPCAVVVGWKILLLIFISPYIIVAFELQKRWFLNQHPPKRTTSLRSFVFHPPRMIVIIYGFFCCGLLTHWFVIQGQFFGRLINEVEWFNSSRGFN